MVEGGEATLDLGPCSSERVKHHGRFPSSCSQTIAHEEWSGMEEAIRVSLETVTVKPEPKEMG
jgi:hypothetical protein